MTPPITWTDEETYLVASLAHAIAGQGRYAEALTLFEGLAAAVPAQPYARRAVAALRLKLGEPNLALAALRDLPADPTTTPLRLDCWLQLDRRSEAAGEFAAISARLEPATRRRYALLLDRNR